MASDIKILWDNTDSSSLTGDIEFDNGDLTRESGLETAVMMSIFTDRRAEDDDILPDSNSTDKRGWWGDLITDFDNERIGSRLWLLDRAKTTENTITDAIFYIEECLQWMIDDGVIQDMNVEVERINRPDGSATLASKIELLQNDGTIYATEYLDLWDAQFGG